MTKASEKEGLLSGIADIMLDEQTVYVQKERMSISEKYSAVQGVLLERIQAVGKTNDPALILAAEKSILVNEKRNYANSPSMINSLDTAIKEMTVAERMLEKVQDPKAYRSTNEDHSLDRNRVRGVPRDEARKALSSHNTRLLNMDKSRYTEAEKKTIKARRSNLHRAEKAYTALQHKALGIAPPGQSHERGLER